MSSSERYSDPRAFAEYNENDGQEIVASALVPLSAGDAFDAWIAHVWQGFTEVTPGVGRGYVGHTRQVPLGITEQIVSAGLPDDVDGGQGARIPSVLYKLRRFGAMPVQDHIGFVRFVQDESAATPNTLVLWTIKVVPSTAGNVFLCGGSVLRVFLRSALKYFLRDMQSRLRKLERVKSK
ncbi:hypothetical protein PybrP1_005915 [[Pythium] brassicae (nom. inval.)]|nr:hypothetical protein PybrP1_005915 [[Pythium] brassicae (nom. inval.)]